VKPQEICCLSSNTFYTAAIKNLNFNILNGVLFKDIHSKPGLIINFGKCNLNGNTCVSGILREGINETQ